MTYRVQQKPKTNVESTPYLCHWLYAAPLSHGRGSSRSSILLRPNLPVHRHPGPKVLPAERLTGLRAQTNKHPPEFERVFTRPETLQNFESILKMTSPTPPHKKKLNPECSGGLPNIERNTPCRTDRIVCQTELGETVSALFNLFLSAAFRTLVGVEEPHFFLIRLLLFSSEREDSSSPTGNTRAGCGSLHYASHVRYSALHSDSLGVREGSRIFFYTW